MFNVILNDTQETTPFATDGANMQVHARPLTFSCHPIPYGHPSVTTTLLDMKFSQRRLCSPGDVYRSFGQYTASTFRVQLTTRSQVLFIIVLTSVKKETMRFFHMAMNIHPRHVTRNQYNTPHVGDQPQQLRLSSQYMEW
jgi:hypothetical protein